MAEPKAPESSLKDLGSSNRPQSKELIFALEICKEAGQIAMRYWRDGVSSQMKEDHTPVTEADRQCEKLIRERIKRQFPGDAILGEEEGLSQSDSSARKWIVDPIDGTYNYARQVPIFSTLLALEDMGEIVLGVVHNPAMKDTYWAEKGCGAYKNGQRIFVSNYSDIADAQFNFGSPGRILADGLWSGFTRLIERSYRQRGFGDYLSFALVFEGKAEAMLEVGLKPWDLAPMKIIVEEAGGKFTDLEGKPNIYSGSCLVSNGLLHDQFLSLLLAG